MKAAFLLIAAIVTTSSLAVPSKRFAQAHAPTSSPATQLPEPPAAPIFYDFKGAKIGTALDEWRAMDAPVRSPQDRHEPTLDVIYKPMHTVCTPGDMNSNLYGLVPNSDDRANGVTVCQYGYETAMDFHNRQGKSFYFKISEIAVGRYTANVRYRFFKNKLYEITLDGEKALLSEVMDGLNAKYGAPTSVIDDTTQNKLGATFPHTVKVWANTASTIRVEAPWTQIDNLHVSIIGNAALVEIEAMNRARNPAKSKM